MKNILSKIGLHQNLKRLQDGSNREIVKKNE
jgi:hypothetical protein